MWREYSSTYIKNNRASSISIITAALISALLLSFLCSLFYNFWTGEIENIILEEGDWQGRITGELTKDDLITIQNFENVEKVTVNEALSEGKEIVVDINFWNMRKIFCDMPLVLQKIGLPENAASYHTLLLSRYLIHDPKDEKPPMLITFYLVIFIVVCLSLILIIRNSFAMSMNARIHQFGIFSSIGATPRQIRICLIQEAVLLCIFPILIGTFMGIVLSIGVIHAMNILAGNIAGAYASKWTYHPLVFAVTISSTVLTVLFSAWLPARKLSKMTPLEAIRNTNEFVLEKKKHSPILSLLFGIEGELAGNNLKAQKKAMRTSTLSLTFSFLAFTLILCFFTLSGISTRHTYFEKYQNVWDIMATIENTKIEDFRHIKELRKLSKAQNVLVYQRAKALSCIPFYDVSKELNAVGGLDIVAGEAALQKGDVWTVKTNIIIMNDEEFLEYCERQGFTPRLDGTIILNQIWDSINSNFRYRSYIPFLTGEQKKIVVQNMERPGESEELSVLGYTKEAPALREEYDDYSLVQFIPVSLWKNICGQIGGAEADMYVRILAKEREQMDVLNMLENEVLTLLAPKYEVEVENRIQEKSSNDDMIFGYMVVLGGLCVILAFIGIANIFSNTLGFLRQRKREFARYISVGMTPFGLRKMFGIEALVVAGRPLFITLPLTVIAVGFMIKASYLNPVEFIKEAPMIPIIVFCFAIFAFVALAYYIGGRRIFQCSLVDALRDDTIM